MQQSNVGPKAVDDVIQVRDILYCAFHLPMELISPILDNAEYWICSTAICDEPLSVTEHSVERPYISVVITGRPYFPLRKLVFETKSHDQGWSSYPDDRGTYRNTWTWFEAGAEFASFEPSDDLQRQELPRRTVQCNMHASSESRTHINTWEAEASPELTEWMAVFRPGDKLLVFPRAKYPGWINHVEVVRVDAYFAWV